MTTVCAKLTTEEQIVSANANTVLARACRMAAAIVIGGASFLVLSQTAVATPEYAKQTGKSCGACHQNPQGGGPLTPEGDKFKAAQKTPPKAPK
jgi:cytochrome c5